MKNAIEELNDKINERVSVFNNIVDTAKLIKSLDWVVKSNEYEDTMDIANDISNGYESLIDKHLKSKINRISKHKINWLSQIYVKYNILKDKSINLYVDYDNISDVDDDIDKTIWNNVWGTYQIFIKYESITYIISIVRFSEIEVGISISKFGDSIKLEDGLDMIDIIFNCRNCNSISIHRKGSYDIVDSKLSKLSEDNIQYMDLLLYLQPILYAYKVANGCMKSTSVHRKYISTIKLNENLLKNIFIYNNKSLTSIYECIVINKGDSLLKFVESHKKSPTPHIRKGHYRKSRGAGDYILCNDVYVFVGKGNGNYSYVKPTNVLCDKI